jgi:hypothetical protein
MKSLKKMALVGRKLWNENTVEIQGYITSLNPILDLQVGKASTAMLLILMSTLERLILEEVLEIN